MNPLTLLLADDHLLVRQSLSQYLESTSDFSVVAEALSADEVVIAVQQYKPQIALIDIELPGDGLRACQEIYSHVPATKVILLSSYDWDVYLVNAWTCNAAAFVVKTATTDELTQVLHLVAAGDCRFTPEQCQRIESWQQTVGEKLQRLTLRQHEVLEMLVAGYTNVEIAEALVISTKTVESHVSQVFAKLQLASRREVIDWAQQTQALLLRR